MVVVPAVISALRGVMLAAGELPEVYRPAFYSVFAASIDDWIEAATDNTD
jgi:hypothetical protein